MVSAIYPGTFDPVHNGHVDIAARASGLFDQLLVAVYENANKDMLFTANERVALFRESVRDLPNVEVALFTGLVPALAQHVGAKFIVRGLRAGLDFETESEMTLMWRSLDPEIDVVCLMSDLNYQFVYSSRIKEVAKLGGNVKGLVTQHVAEELEKKFKSVSGFRD